MEELFKHVGLGVPYVLAAATYGIFWWLDNNIADEHAQVISSWLHGRSQNKPDLGNLIISAFDRIYTSPLLSFRAFRRSAAISTVIWFMLYFLPWIILIKFSWQAVFENLRPLVANPIPILGVEFSFLLFLTVVIDYVSLIFVRKFLSFAQHYPIIASIISSVVGFLTIILSCVLVVIGVLALAMYLDYSEFRIELDDLIVDGRKRAIFVYQFTHSALPSFFLLMRPALVIHLWLPLFALSTLIARLAFWIFRAVEWAQWFLKQGDAHPLKAIGVVATIIVFGSAMLVKEGWAFLGVLARS